ncbi:MAG: Flp pilus assembly complex ATPase component TadA [Actinomycetota bacterium]|nr:Flp pilus assembly complex ATPase component TadA [Actinomycetota bacterium]
MSSGQHAALVASIAAEVADQLAADQARADEAGRPRKPPEDERAYARSLIRQRLEAESHHRLRSDLPTLDPGEEDAVARDAFDRLYGLGRLQRYLDDDRITDVHVQGCDTVWLKLLDGSWERGQPVADSDADLVDLLRTTAARVGRTERRFDAANPELNLQLADGSRLFAVMEVSARPSLSIRKHQFDLSSLADLQLRNTLSGPLAAFLHAAVQARRSIVIGGGVGCGKTTLMRALVNEVPPDERLVTIEDSLELGVDRFPEQHPNVVTLEAREPNIEGEGGISLEQLVRMGLRMGPDRVLVGEVRGSEVLPMLLAMSQGQDGSMCTVHANTARGVFRRLQMYAMLPPHRLAPEDTAVLIANAVDFVVHLDKRRTDQDTVERFVTSVLEVRDADGREVVVNEVFRPGPDGRAVPTGMVHDETLADLERAGLRPGLVAGNGQGGW